MQAAHALTPRRSLVSAAFGVPLGLVLNPMGQAMSGGGGSGGPDDSGNGQDGDGGESGSNSNSGDNGSNNENTGPAGSGVQDDTVAPPSPTPTSTTYNAGSTSYNYTNQDSFGYGATSDSNYAASSLYADAEQYDQSWAGVNPGTSSPPPTYASTYLGNTTLPTYPNTTYGYGGGVDTATAMYNNSMMASTTNNIAQSANSFS